MKLKVAIDIDGVVDVIPKFLSKITNTLKNDNVHFVILTSRSNDESVISQSLAEIQKHGIHFDDYYFLPAVEERGVEDFPKELNWFSRLIWQKAEYCFNHKIDIFFEDDPKTIALIKHYSPKTIVLQVHS